MFPAPRPQTYLLRCSEWLKRIATPHLGNMPQVRVAVTTNRYISLLWFVPPVRNPMDARLYPPELLKGLFPAASGTSLWEGRPKETGTCVGMVGRCDGAATFMMSRVPMARGGVGCVSVSGSAIFR